MIVKILRILALAVLLYIVYIFISNNGEKLSTSGILKNIKNWFTDIFFIIKSGFLGIRIDAAV
jgi:hypothetical protein